MNLGDICSSEYLLADLEEGLEQAVKKLSGQDTAFVLAADLGQVEKVFTDRALLRLYMESGGSESTLEDCVSRMNCCLPTGPLIYPLKDFSRFLKILKKKSLFPQETAVSPI